MYVKDIITHDILLRGIIYGYLGVLEKYKAHVNNKPPVQDNGYLWKEQEGNTSGRGLLPRALRLV